MVSEDRVLIQHNLLQQFDQLIWQVSCHEGLDSHGHILWVLGLTEGSLDHLVYEWTTIGVALIEDLSPEVSVTTPDQVAGLTLEQRVLIANLQRKGVQLSDACTHVCIHACTCTYICTPNNVI